MIGNGSINSPPNSPTCYTGGNATTSGSNTPGLFSAQSRHTGGVNASFADGSVRFVSNSVTIGAWRALSTRSAGDIVAGTF